MTTATSRRAVLAGTATALAVGSAVNLTAITIAKAVHAAPIQPDPTFAAIDRHRAAVLRWLEALAVYGVMRHGEPGYNEAQQAEWETGNDQADAAESLIETVPTTLGGILALTDYITAYNAGGVSLPIRKGLRSSAGDWPCIDEDDGIEMAGFHFVETIAKALKAIASQGALS